MADVGSINYKSEKTEFLNDKTIESIKDSIKSGITNITKSLTAVIDDESGNGLSEESFNVDGEGIIYNKSQEIKKDIESVTDKSSDFSNVLKTIEDHGHAHMAEEAEKWKKERKKHYNQLYDTLKTNVTTYNTYVTIHNNEEYQKQNNTETSYTPKIKEHIKAYKDKNEKVQLSAKPSSSVQYHDQVNAAYEEALAFYPKYKEAVDYYDQLKGSYGDYFASSNILTRVFATSGNLVVAFTSGILKFNEGIDDMGLFVKGHCKSALKHFLGEIAEDFGFEEKGSKLKKEGNKIKEQYNKEILIDHTQETLDRFYENTKAGKWLDRNSYISHDSTAYQFVSVAGQTVPTVAAGAILTALTGGTAAPGVVTALGATLGGSTALGQTAESHYQKTGGKDTVGGYLKMAGFTALGALGGGAEAQAGARYATKVLSSSTKIKLPKDALKDSLDNITKKSDTSLGKNVDNLKSSKSKMNISSLEEKISDGQISNLSEAKKAGFTEYEYNSARAGEGFDNELSNLKKSLGSNPKEIKNNIKMSSLEEKISDGQISNIDDAMKSGYSAKDYRDIANAGQKTNKINVSALEEKISDGQISNLSEAKKAGFTEYEYNSARAGETFNNEISNLKKPVSSTLEDKISDGQISNIDDAMKSGYSAKDYRDIANAGQKTNKINVSALEEKISDGQISNLSEAKKAGFTEYEYNSARAGETFNNEISNLKKPVSSTLEDKISDGQISNIDDAMKSGYSAKDYRDIANAGQKTNKINVSALEEKISDGQISNLSEAKKAGFTEYEYNSARAGETFNNEISNLKKPVSSTLEDKISDGQISNIDDAMKSGYSAKDYRDIANAGQQANKVNVSAVEEKSKMLAPDSVPQTRIEKLKNDFSNAREKMSSIKGKVLPEKATTTIENGTSQTRSNIKPAVSNKVDDIVTGTKEVGHKVYDATIGNAKEFGSNMAQGAKDTAAEKTSDLFSWVRNKTTSKSQTGGEDIDDYLSGINNQTDEVGNGANSFFDN